MKYDKTKVEAAKSRYHIGTRVELNYMRNYERGMTKGLRGTVVGVDDLPSLLMDWDNGRILSLLVGEDSFRKLTQEEIAAENMENEMDDEEDLER